MKNLNQFEKDPISMLKIIGSFAINNTIIDSDNLDSIRNHSNHVLGIPGKLLGEEMTTSMVLSKKPSMVIRLMVETGLMEYIPEIQKMIGCNQNKKWHMEGDCFEHTMLVLDNLSVKNKITCWAALLHDIGKPLTTFTKENNYICSYNHENVGCDIANNILKRLDFPNDDIQKICGIVKNHMRCFDLIKMNERKKKLFANLDYLEDLCIIHNSDMVSSFREDGLKNENTEGYIEFNNIINDMKNSNE